MSDLCLFETSLFVGYQTVNMLQNHLYGCAVQFTEVSGVEELKVTDLLTVDSPQFNTGIGDAADQIWVWKAADIKWKKYYWKRNKSRVVIGWVDSENDSDDAEPTKDTVTTGDGFFFRRSSKADGVITLSGAIKATNAEPIELMANHLHFICNPWPVSVPVKSFTSMLNSVNYNNGIGDAADQIWVWNATNIEWKKYYYKRDRSRVVIGWVDAATDNDSATETEASIQPGECIFFRRSSKADGILTWVKPAGL